MAIRVFNPALLGFHSYWPFFNLNRMATSSLTLLYQDFIHTSCAISFNINRHIAKSKLFKLFCYFIPESGILKHQFQIFPTCFYAGYLFMITDTELFEATLS